MDIDIIDAQSSKLAEVDTPKSGAKSVLHALKSSKDDTPRRIGTKAALRAVLTESLTPKQTQLPSKHSSLLQQKQPWQGCKGSSSAQGATAGWCEGQKPGTRTSAAAGCETLGWGCVNHLGVWTEIRICSLSICCLDYDIQWQSDNG